MSAEPQLISDQSQQPQCDDAYRARLAAEQAIFRDREEVHDLPAIFHYWSNKYVLPKLQAAGFASMLDFFVDPLAQQCDRNPRRIVRFLSIGAGNCDQEIAIAEKLVANGRSNFIIDCLELNPSMLERGRVQAEQRGLADHIHGLAADFNHWQPADIYEAVVAMQALHHVVNLEGLFQAIQGSLAPGGRFIIGDMIGRNGHLRWPEALSLVHEYWRRLPSSYRYNHQLRRYEELFQDWDCSVEGFEGIRAQDILPLLVERFQFHTFIPYANVIEQFVGRNFGPNFDATAEWDRAFIDEIHARDEQEMAQGRLTPANMFAIVGNEPAERHCDPDPKNSIRKSDATSAIPSSGDEAAPYSWKSWPHSPQQELEIAAKRLADATAFAATLQSDREAMAARITSLTQELASRTEWARQLESQFAERTAWSLDLQKQIAAHAALVHALQDERDALRSEMEARTKWALDTQKELDERTTWALSLGRDLAERTAQVRHLIAELAAAGPLIDHGRLGFLPRALRTFIRRHILRRTS